MTGIDVRQSAGSLPGARFIDPAVLARIGNLEIIARLVVEGFINGLHRSPHLGTSMDFAEHRAYMPGDDIRRIDWRLYARSDRYFIKEFEADTNTNFVVLLDVSPSMTFGTVPAGGSGRGTETARPVTKLDYARFIAACLAYFASTQRDRVGLVTFDGDIVDFVPPSAKHLQIVLHTLDRLEPRPEQPGGRSGRPASVSLLRQPMQRLAEHFRRRSMIVLISDLYEDPSDVLDAITHLRGKGNDLIVFHLLDPAEIDFPFVGASNFQDIESGERMPVIPDYLRDEYRKLVAEHTAALGRVLGEHRVDYARFDTSKPLDQALFAYLSNRERLSRTR